MDRVWEFFASLLAVLLLPLVPAFLEYAVAGFVSEQTAAITVAMYAASIGATSRWTFVQNLLWIISILMAAFFGLTLAGRSPAHVPVVLLAYIFVGFTMLLHGSERFVMHVIEKKPFRG